MVEHSPKILAGDEKATMFLYFLESVFQSGEIGSDSIVSGVRCCRLWYTRFKATLKKERKCVSYMCTSLPAPRKSFDDRFHTPSNRHLTDKLVFFVCSFHLEQQYNVSY